MCGRELCRAGEQAPGSGREPKATQEAKVISDKLATQASSQVTQGNPVAEAGVQDSGPRDSVPAGLEDGGLGTATPTPAPAVGSPSRWPWGAQLRLPGKWRL